MGHYSLPGGFAAPAGSRCSHLRRRGLHPFVLGFGRKVLGSEFQGSGFWFAVLRRGVWDSGFRVWGWGFRVCLLRLDNGLLRWTVTADILRVIIRCKKEPESRSFAVIGQVSYAMLSNDEPIKPQTLNPKTCGRRETLAKPAT